MGPASGTKPARAHAAACPVLAKADDALTTLASIAKSAAAKRLLDKKNGPAVVAHACKPGPEGTMPKWKDSRYSSGRSPHWIKSKNPNAPAVKREAEEDWGR
jgi:ATP-dependent DNA ligase